MTPVQANGIEEWSRICSDSFVPLRARGDDSFCGTIKHIKVADIGVSHVGSTPSVVYRNAPLIASEPRDDVLLSIHLSGSGWVDQADRSARLVANTAAAYEADRPYHLRFDSTMSELVLQVPRRRLGLRDPAIRESTARLITADDPGLTVLSHLLAGIIKSGYPAGTGEQLAETALALLSAALRSPTGGARQPLCGEAVLHSVRVYLERHYRDADLDIGTVARRHSVSRRYLELLFERTGESPAACVRGLRLAEARRLLRDSTLSVTEIAHEVGFGDINTFTRSFRRAYGITPRDWRRDPGLST